MPPRHDATESGFTYASLASLSAQGLRVVPRRTISRCATSGRSFLSMTVHHGSHASPVPSPAMIRMLRALAGSWIVSRNPRVRPTQWPEHFFGVSFSTPFSSKLTSSQERSNLAT